MGDDTPSSVSEGSRGPVANQDDLILLQQKQIEQEVGFTNFTLSFLGKTCKNELSHVTFLGEFL